MQHLGSVLPILLQEQFKPHHNCRSPAFLLSLCIFKSRLTDTARLMKISSSIGNYVKFPWFSDWSCRVLHPICRNMKNTCRNSGIQSPPCRRFWRKISIWHIGNMGVTFSSVNPFLVFPKKMELHYGTSFRSTRTSRVDNSDRVV